jgi:hypothetical protein
MTGKRPVSILILGCVYLLVGSIGLVAHFHDLRHPDGPSIELTELLAIVAGAFMLRGRNWARWLALAWMVFHVVLSAFGVLRELAVHSLILAVIAWILFRPEARRYFRGAAVLQ